MNWTFLLAFGAGVFIGTFIGVFVIGLLCLGARGEQTALKYEPPPTLH